MKFSHLLVCVPLAAFLLGMHSAPAGAFVASPVAAAKCSFLRPATALRRSLRQAEERLVDVERKWENLKAVERKWENLKAEEERMLLSGEREAGEKEITDFAVKMVETAIEYAKAREGVKEDQVRMVHAALERALDREATLARASKVVQHDVDDAEDVLRNYESLVAGEDFEKRRELAVADIAHNVESYLEERIHQVHEDEMHLKDEEAICKDEVAGLMFNEAALEHFLGELKGLKQLK